MVKPGFACDASPAMEAKVGALDPASGRARGRALVDRTPPHAWFLVSAVFHYLGPAFAVLLFARVDVLGVAWLRIASAAAIFAAWRQPWRAFAALDRDGRRLLATRGAVLAGIGVGVCSSVIPYVTDQLAMARLSRATYALMVSLLPATATVIGILVLTQVPSATEALGVGLVVAAVAVHRDPAPG